MADIFESTRVVVHISIFAAIYDPWFVGVPYERIGGQQLAFARARLSWIAHLRADAIRRLIRPLSVFPPSAPLSISPYFR
jgi:hypothetical protein